MIRKSIDKKNVVAPIIMVVFALAACSDIKKNPTETDDKSVSYDYQIYCVDAEGTELAKYGYNMDEKLSVDDKVSAMVSVFMKQPDSNEMKSAMPSKLSGIECILEKNVANVRLDKSYKSLHSLEQLFFKAALVLTLTQIEGVDYVYITVNGQPLTDANGVNIRYLTKDSFIMYDETTDAVTTNFYTTVYYVNDDGSKLVARDEIYSYDRSMSPEMFVLELLRINGVNSDDINVTMPEQSVVNNAYTKNGICYVDFNEDINDKSFVGLKADIMLYAVVNSLMELQNVTGVKISIEGKDDVLFRGEIAINEIFHMNLDIIE